MKSLSLDHETVGETITIFSVVRYFVFRVYKKMNIPNAIGCSLNI